MESCEKGEEEEEEEKEEGEAEAEHQLEGKKLEDAGTQLKGESSGSSRRGRPLPMGVLTERLQSSKEAIELRIECADRLRRELIKLRHEQGWPDEDPKANLAETWKKEGPKKEGRMKDGSIVKDG